MLPVPPSYVALMLAAVVLCGLLVRRSQARLPLTAGQKLGLGLGGFCGAFLGARLPFVLSDWEGLVSGAAWFAHGKTILAGIAGGYLGVELAKWVLDVRVKTGDTFAAPVAAAVAVGRLACFAGGCCYGLPTELPWGVRFATAPDGPGLPRHPAQLYEAAFHLAMAGVLLGLGRRGLLRRQLAKFYILCYLAYRFASEFWRPEAPLWLGLTGYQYAALALAPVFAWLWWNDARELRREEAEAETAAELAAPASANPAAAEGVVTTGGLSAREPGA